MIGGGLIRSLGGWSEVKALRRIGERELSDERILGSGGFVKQVTEDMDLAKKYRFSATERRQKVFEAIEKTCEERQIDVEALRSGSRIRPVSLCRTTLAIQLVKKYGLSLAETARQLGVSTSAVAKAIGRNQNSLSN